MEVSRETRAHSTLSKDFIILNQRQRRLIHSHDKCRSRRLGQLLGHKRDISIVVVVVVVVVERYLHTEERVRRRHRLECRRRCRRGRLGFHTYSPFKVHTNPHSCRGSGITLRCRRHSPSGNHRRFHQGWYSYNHSYTK